MDCQLIDQMVECSLRRCSSPGTISVRSHRAIVASSNPVNLGNPSSPQECLDAAKANFDAITDLAGRFISTGRYEPDGTILIRSGDWRSLHKKTPAWWPGA